MNEFTPISALLGGGLIGLAAFLLMTLNGKIAGISGIARGLFTHSDRPDRRWRFAFLLGLMIPMPLLSALGWINPPTITPQYGLLAIAGLLVGFGASLGNGCTSGHGVCGISRGAWRSIVATGTFMLTAIVTVWITHHLINNA